MWRVGRKAVTRQEVAFWRTLPLGNHRDYTKGDWDKSNFVPAPFFLTKSLINISTGGRVIFMLIERDYHGES